MMTVTMKRLAGLILAVILAGALVACGGTSTATTSSAQGAVGTSGAATPSASGSDYRATVIKEHDDIAQSYNRFRGLVANPQPSDMNWRTSVQLQLATWRRNYSEAEKLTPPSDLASFHQQYLAGMEKFNSAADDMSAALAAQTIDVSQFDAAVTKLSDGVQMIQGAMPLLDKQ